MAPKSVHEAIPDLMATLAEPASPSASPTVRLTYWIVSGRAAAEGEIPPELSSLAAPLAAIRGEYGDLTLSLVERLSLASGFGQKAAVRGRTYRVIQTVLAAGDAVVADVKLTREAHWGEGVETRLALEPGRYVLLAEAGDDPTGADGEASLVFYVVQAALEDAPTST
jgi:hypothetical protein